MQIASSAVPHLSHGGCVFEPEQVWYGLSPPILLISTPHSCRDYFHFWSLLMCTRGWQAMPYGKDLYTPSNHIWGFSKLRHQLACWLISLLGSYDLPEPRKYVGTPWVFGHTWNDLHQELLGVGLITSGPRKVQIPKQLLGYVVFQHFWAQIFTGSLHLASWLTESFIHLFACAWLIGLLAKWSSVNSLYDCAR